MERGKPSRTSALRVALVLAMALLLSFAQTVQTQSTADWSFCERFALPYGFYCRQYTAITIDGFLLTAHRISNIPRAASKSASNQAQAPLPPLCVTTADRPFETIPDFVRGSDAPPDASQTSRRTGRFNCIPVAPAPLSSGTSAQEGAPRQAQPISGRNEGLETKSSILAMLSSSSDVAEADSFDDLGPPVSLDDIQPDDSQSLEPDEDDEDLFPPVTTDPQSSLGESAQPVLLMHHEFQNGNSWFMHVDGDSDQLLPILLLNSGFDVWVGHQRATYYGHDHVTLSPVDESYWNWTWDEHAMYDIPALLELVTTETGSAVHFVGISQSATAGAAAATMPFAAPLLKSMTLIGPTIYRGNSTSHTLNGWGALLGRNIARASYFPEPQNGVFNLTADSNSFLSSFGLSAFMTDMSGPNCCLGPKFKVKFNNGWDGTTSMKNLMHYQQGIVTNTWSHFDYGSVMNNSLAYGGSPLPPIYDPDDMAATLPVLVVYGGRDNIAPPNGVRQFVSHLGESGPKGNNSTTVFLPAYAHFDLLYSVKRTQDVFIPVLQFLERQRTLSQ
ncbi:unnamed protein product [Calypogeia fissa]